MKQWKRVVALILTLLLAVYGLPVVPAVQALKITAEEETPFSDLETEETAAVPDTRMRFVQTGFDATTGILTMSLQIKPEPGARNETVREGVFVFQTDGNRVVPITRPRADPQPPFLTEERRAIRAYNGKIAAVLSNRSTMPQAVQEFLATEKAKIISDTGDFEMAMSSQNLYSRYTGYLVSGARKDQGNTSMLDCYFQFYFNEGEFPEPDEEGYVTVIDLDFQCYDNMNPAESTEMLFSGSIHVPETAKEAQEIVDQFYYENSAGEKVSLAMGGAGFIQKYRDEYYSAQEGEAYYYYDEPQLSTWRKNGSASRTTWSRNPAQSIAGEEAPGVWYDNVNVKYLVRSLSVGNNNTVSGDTIEDPEHPGQGIEIPDPDFQRPTNSSGVVIESGRYPRYDIPTYEQSQQNDTEGNWIPEGHQGNGKRPALKYYAGTETSGTTSPEHDDFEGFFTGLKWEFILNDDISLESCEVTEESGEGKLVPTVNGEYYRVKEATLTDPKLEGSKLVGKKLWVVYKVLDPEDPNLDEYFMKAPVGVTLDMVPSEITYADEFLEGPEQEIVRTDVAAPQLHVTHEAANLDNLLWHTEAAGPVITGQKARFAIRAIFEMDGKAIHGDMIDIGLYKGTVVPSAVGTQTENLVSSVTNSAGEPVEGFCVGNTALDGSGQETIKDVISQGTSLYGFLYDQYQAAYQDKWPALELVPTSNTQKIYTAFGKSCPFEITRGIGNSYTIIYRDDTSVNDVVEGEHILRATYTEPGGTKITEEKTVYVSKPKDRLSYMRTSLTNSYQMLGMKEVEENGIKGTVYQLSYEVPARNIDNKVATNTEYVRIMELANQWRDKDVMPEELLRHDLVSGLRQDANGAIDVAKARQKGFTISYELSYPDGGAPQGVYLQEMNTQGKFTYSSNTLEGARFNLRITAAFEGETRFVEYQFQFTRKPRSLQQIAIYPPAHQTGYTIMVPLKAEGTADRLLDVVPVDQYGSQWDWGAVEEAYAPGGRLNQEGVHYDPWSVYVEGELPDGVSLTGANNTHVTVDTTARTSEFKIYAQFGSCRSNTVAVNIVREPSKPTTVQNLIYNGTNEITPSKKNGRDETYTPSVQVYDQYEDLMADYSARWRYTVSPASAAGDISVDSGTGALTVKKCAADCDVTITGVFVQNGSSRSRSITVEVRREPARPDSVEIKETEVPYVFSTDGGAVLQYLTASGTTQYGDDQVFQQGDLAWRLDAVKFPDATLYRTTQVPNPDNPSEMIDMETGDIPHDLSSNSYSARGVVTFTAGGGLRFSSTTLANNIPQEITVTVVGANSVRNTKTIKITRDASVPDRLYFPQDMEVYNNGVQIPENGKTVTVPLVVYVRDQYGVVLENAPVSWSYTAPLPKGVTVNTTAKAVTIDHTASPGSVPIVAACGSLRSTLYLSLRQDEALEPRAVEFTGIKNSSGTVQPIPAGNEVTLPLPAQTGQGYETYTAVWVVRDQFTNPISKMVKWTVENASPGVQAQIYDEYAGMVRLYYTAQALQDLRNGADVGFTLRGAAKDDTTVYEDLKIHLDLDDAAPAYAVPVMTDAGEGSVIENGVVKPVVPPKGAAAKEIIIDAEVYDQYGRKMPEETADIKLVTTAPGLRLTQAAGTSRGTLYVNSTVTGLLVTLQATPHGKPENVRDESSLLVVLSKGTAYAYELYLAETNQYRFDIPYWNNKQMANKPDPDFADQLTLRAEVVDQYGAWMRSDSALYHPLWEFVGDHTGVEFATGDTDGDGIAEGEDVTFNITNRAVPAGQLSHTVTLRLHTSNQAEDRYFTKTVTLRLNREEPESTYLYITGADENGVDTPLQRPYAKDKSVVYQFDPVVYDQYGAPVEDAEIAMDLDRSVLEGLDNILVEEIYKRGESAENGNLPIEYKIYRVEYSGPEDETGTKTLIAEFDRLTGELTVYTECDCLEKLAFTANYEPLGEAGFKKLTVPIIQEELRPYTVKINRTCKDFVMAGSKDPIQDYVYTTIYDQYGGIYTGNVSIQWSLMLPEKDEGGNYLPYNVELDEKGNERPPSQFLVLKNDAPDSTTTLTVQPESFYTNKLILLQCLVIDTRYMMDQSRWVYEYSQISVHRPYNNTGVTVTFDAGEYGKLVGESQIAITSGEAPQNPPGVKTVEGYGFVGWTSDGEMVVDATQIAVFTDITYVAVYKDVTTTRFLEGYGDKTVRPENKITRAEFVSMVVRALGGFDSEKNYGKAFQDVAQGRWYSNSIAYAKQLKIIDGYGDGTFRPNAYITRGEAARILADAAKLTSGKSGTFQDVRPGAWYEKYIEALAEAKVADGYEDGTYRPEKHITRAEAVKLIVMITKNALNDLERTNIQKYAYCPFIDIDKRHWAYAYVLRAAGIA